MDVGRKHKTKLKVTATQKIDLKKHQVLLLICTFVSVKTIGCLLLIRILFGNQSVLFV